MKPIATFFAMLIIGFTMNLSAQTAPVSTLGVVTTNAITGTVPITVTGFTNIYSCSLKILYDQTKATATSVTLGPGVGGSLLAVNLTTPGVIIFSWLGSPSLTLGNGSVFINIHFNKVTNGICNLGFDDAVATDCQYNGVSGALTDTPGTYYVPGSLTFNSNAPVITAPTLILCPGSTVNIPITVANFNNIGAFSLKLTYNTSVLTSFDGGTSSVDFPGLQFGTPGSGEVRISGINTNVSGISLPDNYVLFTLNFTYSPSGGTSALTWVNSGIDGVFGGPLNVPSELTDTPTEDYYKSGSVSAPTSSQKLWTGNSTTTSSWAANINWCPTGAPDGTKDVIIPSTTANGRMPVILTLTAPGTGYDAVCNNLTLMPGSVLTINSFIDGLSGSLRVLGTVSGAGKVVYNRQFKTKIDPDTEENTYDWHYFSSPVGNVTELTQSKISNIYPWDEVAGEWGATVTDVTRLESGRGYNLDQDPGSDGNISFTGSIVSSTSVVATSPYVTNYGTGYSADPGSLTDYDNRIARIPFGGGGWNLLGNPFTSAMNIASFLEANDGDGSVETNKFDPNYVAIYIWDGTNGQYLFRGKVSPFTDPITGDTGPENSEYTLIGIQTGQGFFVLAQKDGVVFNFDKSMQYYANSILLKSASTDNTWPGLKLKVKYGASENSTVVIYNENMTAGLDPGYDIGQLSANPAVEIYTILVNNDKGISFAQQALPLAASDKNVVPVGVDSEKGGEVIFSAITRPINNGTFYLQDKFMGTLTDLSKDTYTVTLPAKTAGTGRFYIHTSMVTGIQPVLANNELGVRIWNNQNKVNIEGAVSAKATGAIYDLMGRQLLQTRLSDSNFNTITVPTSVKGIYMVKVTDGNKVAVRKVVF